MYYWWYNDIDNLVCPLQTEEAATKFAEFSRTIVFQAELVTE